MLFQARTIELYYIACNHSAYYVFRIISKYIPITHNVIINIHLIFEPTLKVIELFTRGKQARQ